MPKLERMSIGGGFTRRAGRLLRVVREDLLSGAAAEPLTGHKPRGGDWRPAVMLPLGLLALVLFLADGTMYQDDHGVNGPAAYGISGVQSAALLLALYRPVPAWWASLLAVLPAGLLLEGDPGVPPFPWLPGPLILHAVLMFLLALRTPLRVTLETLTIGLVTGGLAAWLWSGPDAAPLLPAVLFSLAAAGGAAVRSLRSTRAQLGAQQDLTAGERARRTLLEERSRIARELHDVVAHHMSVVSIQAQVAPHLQPGATPELRANLDGIRDNAVQALTELRRVLGVLRTEEPSDAMLHAPQPTLDRLPELLDGVRAAGLEVTAEVHGEAVPLPPGVQLSAYRIVQEALSNAMRHAPGAAVHVRVGHGTDTLRLGVVNGPPRAEGGRRMGREAAEPERGAASGPGASGHGLLGMRERTAMLGGELATGPTPDGGYEVAVVLPVNGRGERLGEAARNDGRDA